MISILFIYKTLHYYFMKNSLFVKDDVSAAWENASSATCDSFIFSKNIFLFSFIIFIAFKVDYFFFSSPVRLFCFFVSFVWQLDGERMSVIQ